MTKYLTLLTIFVLAGCEHGSLIPIDPIDPPDSPELCQTLLDGKVVVVECDTLTPCTSDSECALGYFCLNDEFCVNDCLTDETCEDRYGEGFVCNVRGRCVAPTFPPVDPPVPVCDAYIGGAVYEGIPCEELTECDPEADECATGTFCLNGDYNYCGSQCFSDTDCPEFIDDNGAALGVHMVCNDRGLCENPEDLPVCDEEEEIIPGNVVFIVDRSGSMDEDFGDTTRYEAVSDALVNVTLAVPGQYVDYLDFSAALYYREHYSKHDGNECAAIVPPGFTSEIEELFDDNSPGGWTPTGEALAEILANNTFPNNTVFVLATDGLPNGCDGRNEQEDRDYSVAQVTAANAAGIPTYVLGIALGDSEGHLTDLANAGGTGLPFFNANDPAELDDALLDIVEHIITPIKCQPLPDPDLPDLDRPEPPIVVP